MFPTKDEIPQGHRRVLEGPIKPDDLLWDVMNRDWMRADSTQWRYTVHDADEAVCCVRKI